MAEDTVLAEQFEYAYSSADSYLSEGESSGPFVTFQVTDIGVERDGYRFESIDAEDFVQDVLRLVSNYIGFPNSKAVRCLLVVNDVSAPVQFEAKVEVNIQQNPVLITFDDGSAVQIDNPSGMIFVVERSQDVLWDEQCESGRVQIAMESVIALVGELDIKRALGPNDRLNLEAALSILQTLVRSSKPDTGLLRASVSWIGSKLDIFATEFARTGGKATAYTTVAMIEIVVSKYFGPLKEHLNELLRLTQS